MESLLSATTDRLFAGCMRYVICYICLASSFDAVSLHAATQVSYTAKQQVWGQFAAAVAVVVCVGLLLALAIAVGVALWFGAVGVA